MSTVTLADDKAHLSHLIDQVGAGNEVVITRRGKPVARITPVGTPRKPLQSPAAFRARMPKARKASAELIRELRDEGY